MVCYILYFLTFLNKRGIGVYNRQNWCLGIKLWLEKKLCFIPNEVKNAVRSVETAEPCKAAYFALRNDQVRNNPIILSPELFQEWH